MKYHNPKLVPVTRADLPEQERDKATRQKAEMEAEFLEAVTKRAAPTKRRGKQILKQVFKEAQVEQPAPVENAMEFRRKILSVSLFPNLYNREMVMTHKGAS
jgi:hypothetical protein